jgi:hypothetical protein
MTTKHIPLRLSPEMHSWIVAKAASEHRSVNGHLTWMIGREMSADKRAAENSVLVGDTYETPEDAAQYAADEEAALKALGADDDAEMRAIEREHERTETGDPQ